MKKYSCWLVASAVSLAGSGMASAADLAARPYTKAPPPVAAVYNWTGFYVGGHLGGSTTNELWVNTAQHVGGGWLRTGDLARQDTDGYIYPTGRLKDTINRGGEKFGPIEVEDAIRTHPAVSDVAVAGITDAEMGQRVGAAVVARSPLTLEDLRSHCRDLIAYFKLPERLKIVDHIPYSDTGKVNRRRLAALIADEA